MRDNIRRLREIDIRAALLYPIETLACLYLSQSDTPLSDPLTSRKACVMRRLRWRSHVNLVVWLPLLFVLGLAGMGVCGWFLLGCERI